MRPHIVIIGGGFAGLSALLVLLKRRVNAKITLIDADGYFEYLPALHLGLTVDHDREIRLDLKRYYGEHLLLAKALKVTGGHVITSHGKVRYDYLVVATGSSTNYFGNDSFERFAHPIKTVDQVSRVRGLVSSADSITVIGAGYTGVEVASVLAGDTSKTINIVDGDAHVLHGVNNRSQLVAERYLKKQHVHFFLGSNVDRCEEDKVVLADGRVIGSDLHLMTAGIRPNDHLLPDNHVNPDLSVQGMPNVFIAGDAARTGVPATGHNAMLEGRHAGENVANLIRGEQSTAFAHPRFTLLGVALGHYWGVVPLGKRAFNSYLVGLLKWAVQYRVMLEFRRRWLLPL